MPAIGALDLDDRLGEAARQPVCALVGDDEGLRVRSLSLLRQAAAPLDRPGSTVREFEGEPEARDVFDELRTIPFLGLEGRRVVILRDAEPFLKSHGKRLAGYLESPSPTSTLILCLRRLDLRSDVGKAILSRGHVVDCSPLKWRAAEGWVRERARRRGCRLTPRAAAELVEALGPQVLGLQNELEKLIVYCGEGGTIAERDVAEVVPQARSRSIFDIGEAVGRRDVDAALRLCGHLLDRGERPADILRILARHVRQLWQIRRALERGESQKQIAGAIGAPPFVVRRSGPTARGLPDEWFARRLKILADADAELKQTSVRAQEEQTWMETTLARLCAGGEGRASRA